MSVLSTLSFDQIAEADLRSLIINSVPETRDLEFKAIAPGTSDSDKREFLKDVTALANTAGGDLIFGMSEVGGVAASLAALTAVSADSEILRLEQVLLASVEPRLVGVRMKPVALASGGYVLLVRVPQSWNPPHRVTHGGVNRYYLRHSSGAYEPSVEQLRAVFLGSAETEQRLHEFRIDRLSRLQTGERGVSLLGRGKLVMQFIPLQGATNSFVIPDVTAAMNDFHPLRASRCSYRHNLDGFLIYSVHPNGETGSRSYTQIFRDGRVEMATSALAADEGRDGRAPVVAGADVIVSMSKTLKICVIGMLKHGATLPIAILTSFLDARGTRLLESKSYDVYSGDMALDRQDLLFAPILLHAETDQRAWNKALIPVFDSLWNAYGFPQCNIIADETQTQRGVSIIYAELPTRSAS